jgi:glycerol-1-phosphate dehydrogenase [NAD(P)+]
MVHTVIPLPHVDLQPFSSLEESRPVSLLYSGEAWQIVSEKLALNVIQTCEVTEATTRHWDQLASLVTGELIVTVGGGLPADAGKYIAQRLNLELLCIPTALSVDAFFTWASGIRAAGCVRYIETKTPDRVLLDLDIIAAAPPFIRAAGITDVLSIATGSWDWRFAHEKGKNPVGMEFIPWVDQNAQSILRGALDCAEAAGRGDREGLKVLYDCLAMEVQLCNQIGHARPEEGSEHYFAYCVENVLGHGLPHGDLVGPGIILAATWQGQTVERLEKALRACHIPLDRIPPDVIAETQRVLPSYCQTHELPFGIAHTLKD